jgi:hypothetical protein
MMAFTVVSKTGFTKSNQEFVDSYASFHPEGPDQIARIGNDHGSIPYCTYPRNRRLP